jgi:hypothetical protein
MSAELRIGVNPAKVWKPSPEAGVFHHAYTCSPCPSEANVETVYATTGRALWFELSVVAIFEGCEKVGLEAVFS